MSDQKRIAIFPGTFDPISNGHVDVIRRGVKLFDELIVAVGDNPEKSAVLEQNERAQIIREIVGDIPNLRVECYTGLTVEFAKKNKAAAILRGIRNTTDLHFEFQVALTSRVVAGMETVFIMTSPQYAFTSSSLIRQIVSAGGDVSALVPPQVLPHIKKLCTSNTDHALHESE